jgi:hypothetical protein
MPSSKRRRRRNNSHRTEKVDYRPPWDANGRIHVVALQGVAEMTAPPSVTRYPSKSSPE